MNFEEKLANVVNRYEEVQALLSTNISSDELVKLNKELSVLEPVVGAIENYKKHTQSMQDDKAMMEDASLDKEMREMAEAEYYEIKEQLPEMEKEIRVLLLPKEADDEKNAIATAARGEAFLITSPTSRTRVHIEALDEIRMMFDEKFYAKKKF